MRFKAKWLAINLNLANHFYKVSVSDTCRLITSCTLFNTRNNRFQSRWIRSSTSHKRIFLNMIKFWTFCHYGSLSEILYSPLNNYICHYIDMSILFHSETCVNTRCDKLYDIQSNSLHVEHTHFIAPHNGMIDIQCTYVNWLRDTIMCFDKIPTQTWKIFYTY